MSKILIIEDEQYLSEMYQTKFKAEGFEVVVAMDGPAGIEMAKKEQPNLVLLDLVLPKMDGFEVLANLRKDPATKNLKIYICSNLGQSSEIDRGIKEGADGYFVKSSITPSQLADKVKRILAGETVEDARTTGSGLPGGPTKAKKLVESAPKEFAPNALEVLLIEDEQSILDMYQARMHDAGIKVETAQNGAWGLKEALAKGFDLIIMDMQMPAMNGLEAIKKLKVSEKTKDTPLFVVTNSAQDKDMEEIKKMGVSKVFLKSQVTPSRLIQEISTIYPQLTKA